MCLSVTSDGIYDMHFSWLTYTFPSRVRMMSKEDMCACILPEILGHGLQLFCSRIHELLTANVWQALGAPYIAQCRKARIDLIL